MLCISIHYMRRWTGSALVQLIACRLFVTKPSPEPMLAYCHLDPWEQISVKIEIGILSFSFKKMYLKMSCLSEWWPFGPGRDELTSLMMRPKCCRWTRLTSLLLMLWCLASPGHQRPWASCQIRNIVGCACAGNAGNVFPPLRVSDLDMHHGTCVMHVPWCMPGSLTSGFLWCRWRGKLSRHSRRMRNPQFYISGKRPMALTTQDTRDLVYLYDGF